MAIRVAVTAWKDDPSVMYHTLLCAAGYESRSRFVAERLCDRAIRRVAIGFDYHHACAIEENVAWLGENGWFDWNRREVFYASDEKFEYLLRELLRDDGEPQGDELRIGVDISSLSSVRLAAVVERLWTVAESRDLTVDFLYAPGKDYIVNEEGEQIEFAGPVNRRLAGWSSEPERPVVAVFCLGLEYDRAIGAFEYVNPSLTYTFATDGATAAMEEKMASDGDSGNELSRRIQEANRQLLPLVPPEMRFSFDVKRPMDCYGMVRSVSIGAMRYGRLVFVPLGPKLFSLCAMLVANEFYPSVAVWRISTGRKGEARDIVASGDVVGLRVRMRNVG